MKEVMIVTGAGQISMAIARRVGYGMKIVLGDKNMDNCKAVAKVMTDAGFDVEPFEMDLSSRESILSRKSSFFKRKIKSCHSERR